MLAIMGTASAATITFNLTNSSGYGTYGNVLGYSSGGVNMTVTSWGLTGNSGTTFQTAATGRWSGGLGVCDNTEGLSCGSPQHTVDNSGFNNFILFQFSTPVDPLTVSITQYQSDSDLSYWVGNVSSSTSVLVGQTLAGLSSLGFGSRIDDTAAGSRTISLTSPFVNALLISAKVGETNDYFKINQLTVNPVPEPSTYATLGGALLGLALVMARRRRRQN